MNLQEAVSPATITKNVIGILTIFGLDLICNALCMVADMSGGVGASGLAVRSQSAWMDTN